MHSQSTVAISGDEITEEVDKDDHEIRLLADTVEELDAQVKGMNDRACCSGYLLGRNQ